MIKRFCCSKFQFHYLGDKQMGLNIRIVKLSKEFMERGQLKFNKNYLITEGYSENILECKSMVIQFCPFCGTELKSIYGDDEYTQETI